MRHGILHDGHAEWDTKSKSGKKINATIVRSIGPNDLRRVRLRQTCTHTQNCMRGKHKSIVNRWNLMMSIVRKSFGFDTLRYDMMLSIHPCRFAIVQHFYQLELNDSHMRRLCGSWRIRFDLDFSFDNFFMCDIRPQIHNFFSVLIII